MNKAYIAGTNALAPSAPILLLETFKMDIAPLALLAHCGCPNFQMSKVKLYMKAGRISNLIFN